MDLNIYKLKILIFLNILIKKATFSMVAANHKRSFKYFNFNYHKHSRTQTNKFHTLINLMK